MEAEGGVVGEGQASTGTSVGRHKPDVLTDGDKSKYNRLGVLSAVENVNSIIAHSFLGENVLDQFTIDAKMHGLDDSGNFKTFGGNAVCSVSIAVVEAAAAARGVPFHQHLADGHTIFAMNIVLG